ncbi:MAG: hypothetical protein LBQ76_08795 [Candidatus Fibromonas sp.]|jgi:hypothetical protein|nr:hypothetical protein [Candidatus Fibromonas sp.]
MRILLYITLCLLPVAFWGCQTCREHQDVAGVVAGSATDSIAIKVNDYIIGCGYPASKVIGSETHHIQFPINIRVQLFSGRDLWEELSFEIPKNATLEVYKGEECSSYESFPRAVEKAKKNNALIDSSLTDNYCWLISKIDREAGIRCTELSVDGEQDLCWEWTHGGGYPRYIKYE